MMPINTLKKGFGIEALGALTVNPEVLPGAKQLAEIKYSESSMKVLTVYFLNLNLILVSLKQWLKIQVLRHAVLDPLGAELELR